jgi:hypothetical protein
MIAAVDANAPAKSATAAATQPSTLPAMSDIAAMAKPLSDMVRKIR